MCRREIARCCCGEVVAGQSCSDADAAATANQVLGALHLEMARRFDLVPEGVHDIRWVIQFPMFTYKPEEQRWDAEHHPFTAPATADGAPATAADMDDPAALLSRSYDLVLDGNEIGGGSVRNHRTDVQSRIFELIGINEEEAQARFGFAEEDARGIARTAPERNYRDPNHKPELLCALTEFDALCGFRPVEETLRLLAELKVAELAPVAAELLLKTAAEIAGAPNEYVHSLRTRPARNIGPGTTTQD